MTIQRNRSALAKLRSTKAQSKEAITEKSILTFPFLELQRKMCFLPRRDKSYRTKPPCQDAPRRASETRKTRAVYLETTPSEFFDVPRSPPQADWRGGFVR